MARKGGADILSSHLTVLLNDSLYATYAGHFDVERLARDVVPELDSVPVKEPLW